MPPVARAVPADRPAVLHEARLLATLSATLFLTITNINMLAPLLVDLAAEFHTSVGSMGQVVAVSAVPWAIVAPFMGALSDRYGRKQVLAGGVAGLGLITALSAFTWSYGSLFAFRLLGTVPGATTGPNLMSGPANYFPPHRQGQAGGIILLGISLATVMGVPMVAAASAYFGWRMAFAGEGVLLILLAGAIWQTVPRAGKEEEKVGVMSGLAAALRERSTRFLLLANALERISFNAVGTYLAAFLMQSYGLRLEHAAPVLSAIAMGTLLGALLGGRLADRGRQALQYVGFEAVAAGLALFLFATQPGVLSTSLVAAAFGISSSMARPAWLWLMNRVPPSVRTTTMGFASTTNQIGIVGGAAIGGALVGAGSYSLVGVLACTAAIAGAAACFVGGRSLRATQ